MFNLLDIQQCNVQHSMRRKQIHQKSTKKTTLHFLATAFQIHPQQHQVLPRSEQQVLQLRSGFSSQQFDPENREIFQAVIQNKQQIRKSYSKPKPFNLYLLYCRTSGQLLLKMPSEGLFNSNQPCQYFPWRTGFIGLPKISKFRRLTISQIFYF